MGGDLGPLVAGGEGGAPLGVGRKVRRKAGWGAEEEAKRGFGLGRLPDDSRREAATRRRGET